MYLENLNTLYERCNEILRPTTKFRIVYSILNLVVGRKLYFYFTTYNEIENTTLLSNLCDYQTRPRLVVQTSPTCDNNVHVPLVA
jgi:hypothetical protein